MENPWNKSPPKIDENFKRRMIQRSNDYLKEVNWKSNCLPSSLNDAIEEAMRGNDAGFDKTMALRPRTMDFNDWMLWSNLVCCLFNRDTPYSQILSSLRNP